MKICSSYVDESTNVGTCRFEKVTERTIIRFVFKVQVYSESNFFGTQLETFD